MENYKASHRECITLKESNKKIENNEELAKMFNTFFSKIVPSLNIDNNLRNNITNSTTKAATGGVLPEKVFLEIS